MLFCLSVISYNMCVLTALVCANCCFTLFGVVLCCFVFSEISYNMCVLAACVCANCCFTLFGVVVRCFGFP